MRTSRLSDVRRPHCTPASNGDGTFRPARLVHVGRGMAKIAVGNFNRDNVKDLAIAGDS